MIASIIAGRGASETPAISVANITGYAHEEWREAFWHDNGLTIHRTNVARVLERLAGGARRREALWARWASVYPSVFEMPLSIRRYPLVQVHSDCPDHLLAPLPNLILEWLYEPLMDALFEACTQPGERACLDDAFEEYVGLLLKETRPGIRWFSEAELARPSYDGKLVDWVGVTQDFIFLVEVKRNTVAERARVLGDEREWAGTERQINKAATQTGEFLQNYPGSSALPRGQIDRLKPVRLMVAYGRIDPVYGVPPFNPPGSTPGPINLSIDALQSFAVKPMDDGAFAQALLRCREEATLGVLREMDERMAPPRSDFFRGAFDSALAEHLQRPLSEVKSRMTG